MNEETRSKLSEMVQNGLINNESFLCFFRRPSNSSLKDLMKSQYSFTPDKITNFKVALFDTWRTCETVFNSDEIIVLVQLVHNSGVLTRKELLRNTRLTQNRLSNAIEGLLEEKLIEVLTQQQNEKLVYLSVKKFKELIKDE